MALTFERGDPREPRGHAIMYFKSMGQTEEVLATYVVALPVALDFTRYVPPMLSSRMGNMAQPELSSFAMPPMPDDLGSHDELRRLAEIRGDDFVFAGSLSSRNDIAMLMRVVNEAVAEYCRLWAEFAKSAKQGQESAGEVGSLGVDDVLYSFLSERDRLTELSKFLGKLRFAVEGRDAKVIKEVEADIRVLAKHLPEKFRIGQLLATASEPTPAGSRLAQFYLDRAYALADEQFERVREIELRITELERK